MSIQLPLPGYWPRNMSRRDPEEALAEIERDRVELKHRMRLLLDEYADKHDIQARAINELVYGYVDDMLSDLFFDRQVELQDEIDADIAREGL